MNIVEIATLLLLIATAAVTVSPKLGLPVELTLLIGSFAMSLVPGLPVITLKPQVVFLVFLPPILFAAAYFTSWRDFKNNIRPISLLAIGLVAFTTLMVGVVIRRFLPEMPWAVAFLLGAIVSPPDASAATAITRKLGIPRRLLTIIEGESLINDATALVAYRFALAAVFTGSFSWWDALGQFLWAGFGGAVVGLTVAKGALWLFQKLKDTNAETTLTLLTSFFCYILAEHVGVSGVLSTVAGGLYFGRKIPLIASAKTRMEAEAVWSSVLFIINGFVFTLMGLQLPSILKGLHSYSKTQLMIYAVITSVTVVMIRFAWVFPVTFVPRLLFRSIAKKDPLYSLGIMAVLSWTGMRGIVSLAAALALPVAMISGEPFPYRELLIFLTYSVIVATVILPSITLPYLMRWLNIRAGQERFHEEALARVRSTEAVLDKIKKWESEQAYAPHLLTRVKERFDTRLTRLRSNLNPEGFSILVDEDLAFRRLMRATLETERKALHFLRAEGVIHDEVFHLLGRELDLEDLRLKTQRF